MDIEIGPDAATNGCDGMGQQLKQVRSDFREGGATSYFVRSSVLGGQVFSEVGPTGKKKQTFVYAAGAKFANQGNHV